MTNVHEISQIPGFLIHSMSRINSCIPECLRRFAHFISLPKRRMKRHVEMRYAYQELLTPSMFPLALSIIVVLTTLFTLWDPMRLTHTMSALQRVGFLVFVGCSDLLIGYSCGVLLLYLSRFRSKCQSLSILAVAAPVVAVPCTAIMGSGYALFHEGRAPGGGILELYVANAINLLWTAVLIFYVLRLRLGRRDPAQPAPDDLSAAFSADRRDTDGGEIPLTAEGPADDSSGSPDAPQPEAGAHRDSQDAVEGKPPRPPALHIRPVAAQRLLESLPEPVGQDVVYVHVSGHYLEVVTTSGSVVVLMRLADAVAALGDRGMQIHRSYWVASHHIRHLVRRDHRTLLCLTDGYEIPVSQPFLPTVRNFISKSTDSTVQKDLARSSRSSVE